MKAIHSESILEMKLPGFCFYTLYNLYKINIINSAFKQLIASKIKVFVYIIYVYTVYIYYVYKYTHILYVYFFKYFHVGYIFIFIFIH